MLCAAGCCWSPSVPAAADGFLVTEAVRGEGAWLLDAHGKRFVDELLPRDEVARAVQRKLTASGAQSVALDMRHGRAQLDVKQMAMR